MPDSEGPPYLAEVSTIEQVREWAIASGPFVPDAIPADDIAKTMLAVRELLPTVIEQLLADPGVYPIVITAALCQHNDPEGHMLVVMLEMFTMPKELRELIEVNVPEASFRLLATGIVVKDLSPAALAKLKQSG